RVVGIALIGYEHVRAFTGPAGPRTVHRDRVQHRDQLRVVAALARGEQNRQRSASPVDREVDLRAQPAPGPADRLAVRRAGRKTAASPFLRAPAACWCARTTDESTLTTHSTGCPSS